MRKRDAEIILRMARRIDSKFQKICMGRDCENCPFSAPVCCFVLDTIISLEQCLLDWRVDKGQDKS